MPAYLRFSQGPHSGARAKACPARLFGSGKRNSTNRHGRAGQGLDWTGRAGQGKSREGRGRVCLESLDKELYRQRHKADRLAKATPRAPGLYCGMAWHGIRAIPSSLFFSLVPSFTNRDCKRADIIAPYCTVQDCTVLHSTPVVNVLLAVAFTTILYTDYRDYYIATVRAAPVAVC